MSGTGVSLSPLLTQQYERGLPEGKNMGGKKNRRSWKVAGFDEGEEGNRRILGENGTFSKRIRRRLSRKNRKSNKKCGGYTYRKKSVRSSLPK